MYQYTPRVAQTEVMQGLVGEFIRRTLTTVSTSTGDYQFCGVPFGSMLEIAA